MLCSICFNEIPKVGDWDSGNNAYPVNHGRCCDGMPPRCAACWNDWAENAIATIVKFCCKKT